MKKELSPAVMAIGVVVALLIVAGAWYGLSSRETGVYVDPNHRPSAEGRGGRASAREQSPAAQTTDERPDGGK